MTKRQFAIDKLTVRRTLRANGTVTLADDSIGIVILHMLISQQFIFKIIKIMINMKNIKTHNFTK